MPSCTLPSSFGVLHGLSFLFLPWTSLRLLVGTNAYMTYLVILNASMLQERATTCQRFCSAPAKSKISSNELSANFVVSRDHDCVTVCVLNAFDHQWRSPCVLHVWKEQVVRRPSKKGGRAISVCKRRRLSKDRGASLI